MKARYSYYADGTKYSVTDATGSSRIYAGNLVYVKRNGVQGLESAAFGGGRFRTSLVIGGVAYIPDYFITDHLGSTRAIIENGQVTAQYNYYPYGGEWSTSSQLVSDDNRYKFSGKEDQATFGAPIYDFHARSYTTMVPMFLQQDPKAEDYYSISPYAYCAGNPVKYIDPNGKDIWQITPDGNVAVVQDKEIYRISFVDSNGEEKRQMNFEKDQISYRVDKDDRGKTINMFHVTGDRLAEKVYANSIIHTDNKIEYELVRVGTEQSEKNVVGTSNAKEETSVGITLINRGYTIREHSHNHPSGENVASDPDVEVAAQTRKYFPNAQFYINIIEWTNNKPRITKTPY